jgi:hypothetical protein
MGREKGSEPVEAIEVICPRCRRTEIVYRPKEDIPKCKVQMLVKEVLTEGKSY